MQTIINQIKEAAKNYGSAFKQAEVAREHFEKVIKLAKDKGDIKRSLVVKLVKEAAKVSGMTASRWVNAAGWRSAGQGGKGPRKNPITQAFKQIKEVVGKLDKEEQKAVKALVAKWLKS